MIANGKLVIIGTPIGNLGDLTPRAARALAGLDVIACEDTRRTSKLLSHLGLSGKRLLVSNDHTERAVSDEIVALLSGGLSVGFVSDAGMPSVSDPGERTVRAVVSAGFEVDVLPGPTALTTALVASGFSSGSFVFEGFLARKGEARRKHIEQTASETRTVIFYESPNRLGSAMAEMAEVLGGDRRVFIGRELTKLHQEHWRGTLREARLYWQDRKVKGEVVIVLEGAPLIRRPLSDSEIREALSAELQAGSTRRDAVGKVVELTGEPKRRVYALAVALDD